MNGFGRRAFLKWAAAASTVSAFAGRAGADTMNYDDGNANVPGGISGSVDRVVVVGAGFSGLVIANALRIAGVDVVVVEGRNRIGGRISTQQVGGVPLDLGAAWVHGTIGNPVATWAAQVGVPLIPADPSVGDLSGYDALTGSISSGDSATAFGTAQDFLSALPALRAALGANASVLDGTLQHLDNEGFTGDTRRLIEFLIRTGLVELSYGGSAAEMSLGWYFEDLAFAGLDHVPAGGYQTLLEPWDVQLDIRLGETVTGIAYGPGGVAVTTTSDVHAGSHAVVTVPLGVLRSGAIGFSPALPAPKAAAIAALDMGSLERIILQFGTAFWQAVSPPRENFFYISSAAQGEYPIFLDWTAVAGGVPTLACSVAGDFGASLTGLSEAAITARLVAILSDIFPSVSTPLLTPAQVVISDWEGDPFTRGAFSFIPVGANPSDMDELGAPVAGRLLFAGEATQSDYYGTVHGAMLSGIREAKRLLAQPAVLLPEPHPWVLQGLGIGALIWLARWREDRSKRRDTSRASF